MNQTATQPMTLEQMINRLQQPKEISPAEKQAIVNRLLAAQELIDRLDEHLKTAENQLKICPN